MLLFIYIPFTGVKEEMKKNIKHLTKTPGQSATVSPICEITEKRRKRAENALAKVTATNTRHSLEKEINAALNLVESDDSSDMPLTQQHSTLPFVPPHSNSYPMYNAQYPPQYAPQYTMAPQPSTQLQQPEHHQQLWPGSQEIERGLSAKIDKLISSIENLSDRVEKLESNKPSGGEPECKYDVSLSILFGDTDDHNWCVYIPIWIDTVFNESPLFHLPGTGKFIGGSLSLSEGQLATIKCLASSQNWQYTLRKVLSMLYDDKELAGMCAIGRKGAQHQAVDKEDLGALKGICATNLS